ncbi:MarR family winged helix-turn-helix transcriptional regulator [Chitinophaga sp. RAB17]|uniref:MarR family winged helix-turn-helix transcriptional regulator n=1 Tax=Chitinophaga sp. RAB17 TaxID=3233049 RepID=UPI003F90578B
MNQTVELVRLWGEYEQSHPGATIEGFCRSTLAGSIRKERTVEPEWQLRPDLNGALIKLISRIGKFQMIYTNKALEGTGLDQIEEFGIMVAIFNGKEPIKSEVIFSNMLELSSGTNILVRLKSKSLISEYDDQDDKRVKRLQLTKKGEKVLKAAKEQILKVVGMLAQDLTEDDKQLCLQLLTPIDSRFSAIIQKQKGKPFDEIYQENTHLR